MGMGVWFVVWACIGAAVWAEELNVEVGAPFCEHSGHTLNCDYKGTKQVVNMVHQVNEKVQKVFVYNAVKLQLSEAVCVSVMVTNVVNVVVAKDEGNPCGLHFELSARNSALDRLPTMVNNIHLEDSTITSLATTVNITQLNVINSDIKVLDISSPLHQSVTANFVSATIATLQKLYVSSGAKLSLQSTKIVSVPPKALIIDGGNFVMRNSSISRASEDSVIVYPGTNLRLQNSSSNFKIGFPDTSFSVTSQPEPGNTSESSYDCKQATSYFGAFIFLLVLQIVSIIIIIFGLLYVKKNYVSINTRHVEEKKHNNLKKFCPASEYKNEEEQELFHQSISSSFEHYKDSLIQLRTEFSETLKIINSNHKSDIMEEKTKYEEEFKKKREDLQEKLRENANTKTKRLLELEKERKNIKSLVKLINVAERKIEVHKDLIEAEYEKGKTKNIYNEEADTLKQTMSFCNTNHTFCTNICEIIKNSLSKWKESLRSSEVLVQFPGLDKLVTTTEDLMRLQVTHIVDQYETQRVKKEIIITKESTELNEKFEKDKQILISEFKMKFSELEIKHEEYKYKAKQLPEEGKKMISDIIEATTKTLEFRNDTDLENLKKKYSGDKDLLRHQKDVETIQQDHIIKIEKLVDTFMNVQEAYVHLLENILDQRRGGNERVPGSHHTSPV